MEKNLNVAPTEQELINAGFERRTHDKDGYNYTYSKDIGDNLQICIHTDYKKRCASLYIYDGTFLKDVDLTKAAINKEFEHFKEPLPQWGKPQPKVGEVWANECNTLVISPKDKNFSGISIFYIYNSSGYELMPGSYTSFEVMKDFGYKKVADSIEQYYKGEKPEPQQIEQPYSHSNLKNQD